MAQVNYSQADVARVMWGNSLYQDLPDLRHREPADHEGRLRPRLERHGLRRAGIRSPDSIIKSLCHQIFGNTRLHRYILGALVSQLRVHGDRYLHSMTIDRFEDYCDSLEDDLIDAGYHFRVVEAAADLFGLRVVDIGSFSEYAVHLTVPYGGTFKGDIYVCSTPGHMDSLIR